MSVTRQKPFVTLSYAQSIDGSIAARPGVRLALSGDESLRFTHQLRATHDAILVGIGTVLADDPQLNVRYIQGPHPRPVILDSRLRCPPTARCLEAARHPIVATTQVAPIDSQHALEAVGALVMRLPSMDGKIDLSALLTQLCAEDIRTLMVEGGARVISSFLRAHLVDRVIITLAPTLIGGVRAVDELLSDSEFFPRLRHAAVRPLGEDWIVAGEIDWNGA